MYIDTSSSGGYRFGANSADAADGVLTKMVVCKYFQQGNCRFGQYCRFEHVGGFAGGAQGAGNKGYGDSKSIVLGVAEEVLAAERGGQWLLSCFGPFKEGACIPGMEDVSPEEVRWEMYQAQKSGNVEQTKVQFQQLCQTMTSKREALKNPTHETADMLDKLQKFNRDSGFAGKSNFVLSTPQLGGNLPGNPVFPPKKSFGTTGAFGEGFTSPPVSQPSIFGRSSGNSGSFFGAAPAFGAFATPQPTNSIFGGGTKSASSVFGNTQSLSPFGATPSATTTPVVSQPTTSSFNTGNNQNLFSTNQQNSIFSTTQSTSVFGGGTTVSNSVFSSGQRASQGGQGGNAFGGGTGIQQGGQSVFGGGSSSVFGQAKNTVAFGSAPVFGATGGGVFVEQGTFTNSGSAFGQTTVSSSFNSSARSATSFAALASSAQPLLATSNTTTPFANTNNPSIPVENTTFVNPVIPSSGVFGQPSSAPGPFGNAIEPPEKFGNNPIPFSSTATAPANNPFLPKSQVSGEAFRQSPFAGAGRDEATDESVYSTEEDLSENDRKIYLSHVFTLANIPVKPPTIELR